MTVYKPNVNDTVLLTTRKKGIIRYIGNIDGCKGTYYGIEFEYPYGDCAGIKNGKKYFKCALNHGLFVKRNKISKPLRYSKAKASMTNVLNGKDVIKNITIPNKIKDQISVIIRYYIFYYNINQNFINDDLISLIYMYYDTIPFQFVKLNHNKSVMISKNGTTVENLNQFNVVLLGSHAIFPYKEWELTAQKSKEFIYSFEFERRDIKYQNGHQYFANGFVGIIICSKNFVNFNSLQKLYDKTKVYEIIQDKRFADDMPFLPKEYGKIKPKVLPFLFGYKKRIYVTLSCKYKNNKWTHKITFKRKTRDVKLGSTAVTRKFEKTYNINVKKSFRIGFVLYGTEEANKTFNQKNHVSIYNQNLYSKII